MAKEKAKKGVRHVPWKIPCFGMHSTNKMRKTPGEMTKTAMLLNARNEHEIALGTIRGHKVSPVR